MLARISLLFNSLYLHTMNDSMDDRFTILNDVLHHAHLMFGTAVHRVDFALSQTCTFHDSYPDGDEWTFMYFRPNQDIFVSHIFGRIAHMEYLDVCASII